MFLPAPVTLVSLLFLPDQIPAHYGFDNQVTRWGSKYETLIFPVITIIFGLIMLECSKVSSKSGEKTGENNEKACITAGIFSLLIFNAMTGYFLYTDFNKVENLSSVPVDIFQLIFSLLGIFMIVIGSIMPKLQKNSVIGLRTHWSMKNEMEEKPTVWREFIYHSWNPYDIGLLFYKRDCLLSVVDGHLACLPPH